MRYAGAWVLSLALPPASGLLPPASCGVFVDVDDRRALLVNEHVSLLLNRSHAGVEILRVDLGPDATAPPGGVVTTKAVLFSSFDFDFRSASSRDSRVPEVTVMEQRPDEVGLRAAGIEPRSGVRESWLIRLRAGEPGFSLERTTAWGEHWHEAQRHGLVLHAPKDFDTFYLANTSAGMVHLWRPTTAQEMRLGDALDARTGQPYTVWLEGTPRHHSTAREIGGTDAPRAYQRETWGDDFTYHFFLPNGRYQVELGFAEAFVSRPGERQFDVEANGQRVLDDFDILDAAGGKYRAVQRSFPATVTDGCLALRFVTQTKKQAAKVNVIRVWNETVDARLNCGREWRDYEALGKEFRLGDLADNPSRTVFLARGETLPGVALELTEESRWAAFWEYGARAVRLSGEASPARLAPTTTQTAFVRFFDTDAPDSVRETLAADVSVPELPLGEFLRNQQLKDTMATLRRVKGVLDRQYTSVNPFYEHYWIRNAFGQIVGAYPFASPEVRRAFRRQIDLGRRCQREDGAIPEVIRLDTQEVIYRSVVPSYADSQMLDPTLFWVWGVYTAYALDRDADWLVERIEAVERAVDFLSAQDRDGDGLMEMDEAGDWADHVERSGETAYANAFFYQTLQQVAALEEALGRMAQAQGYRTRAARLRTAYNRPVALGGLWDERLAYLRGCRKEGWDYIELDSLLAAYVGVVEDKRAKTMLSTYLAQPGVSDPVPGKLSCPTYSWRDATWSGYQHRWTWLAVIEAMALNRIGATEEAYDLYRRIVPLGVGKNYLREFYRDTGEGDGQYDIWYYGFNCFIATDLLGLDYSPQGLRFQPHFPSSWVNANGTERSFHAGRRVAAAVRGFRYGGATLDLFYDRDTPTAQAVRWLEIDGRRVEGNRLPPDLTEGRHTVVVHWGE